MNYVDEYDTFLCLFLFTLFLFLYVLIICTIISTCIISYEVNKNNDIKSFVLIFCLIVISLFSIYGCIHTFIKKNKENSNQITIS